jgi:hypothetical protein
MIGLLLPLWLNLSGGGGPVAPVHGDAPGDRLIPVKGGSRVIAVACESRVIPVRTESRVMLVSLDDEAPMETRYKDPGDTLDFTRDFGEFLESGEELDSVDWGVTPSGPTIGTGSYVPTVSSDGKRATVWIAGGTAGVSYTVTATATTDNAPPRIKETSFKLEVAQQ